MSLDKVTTLDDCEITLNDQGRLECIKIKGMEVDRLNISGAWARFQFGCSEEAFSTVKAAFRQGDNHINAALFGAIFYHENYKPHGHWWMDDGEPGGTTDWDETVRELLNRWFFLCHLKYMTALSKIMICQANKTNELLMMSVVSFSHH